MKYLRSRLERYCIGFIEYEPAKSAILQEVPMNFIHNMCYQGSMC